MSTFFIHHLMIMTKMIQELKVENQFNTFERLKIILTQMS